VTGIRVRVEQVDRRLPAGRRASSRHPAAHRRPDHQFDGLRRRGRRGGRLLRDRPPVSASWRPQAGRRHPARRRPTRDLPA